MKKKEIIIDRSKWRTGGNNENSTGEGFTYLLNNEGYKCCLGFLCQQVTKKKISDRIVPSDMCILIKGIVEKNNLNFFKDTELVDRAININDDTSTTPREKEKALKDLFKDSPYKLTFKGEFKKNA